MKHLQWSGTLLSVLGMMFVLSSVNLAFAQADAPDSAVEQILFIARPSDGNEGDRFRVEVQPGESVSLALVLENQMANSLSLRSYVANVYPGPNGGMQLEPEGRDRVPPTTWVDLDARTDEIQPDQVQDVPFTVTVPEETPSGEYVSAIAVETVDSFEIEGSTTFRQRLRKVVPLYIIVPGPLSSDLQVTGDPYLDVRSRGPVVVIPVENKGNARVRAVGALTLFDKDKTELANIQVIMNWVYGGSGTNLEIRLPGMLPEGTYLFDLELLDKEQKVVLGMIDSKLVVEDVGSVTNPLSLTTVDISATGEPIQLASVGVEVKNDADVVPSARLTMSVYRDGKHVEDFVLADSLVIPNGRVMVQQRYLPLSGWESGTYTFSLKLESVETGSGSSALLLSQDNVATIEVP